MKKYEILVMAWAFHSSRDGGGDLQGQIYPVPRREIWEKEQTCSTRVEGVGTWIVNPLGHWKQPKVWEDKPGH